MMIMIVLIMIMIMMILMMMLKMMRMMILMLMFKMKMMKMKMKMKTKIFGCWSLQRSLGSDQRARRLGRIQQQDVIVAIWQPFHHSTV